MAIFDFIAALFFVASSGLLFNKRFREHGVLVICAGLVALVSTYYLTRQIAVEIVSEQLNAQKSAGERQNAPTTEDNTSGSSSQPTSAQQTVQPNFKIRGVNQPSDSAATSSSPPISTQQTVQSSSQTPTNGTVSTSEPDEALALQRASTALAGHCVSPDPPAGIDGNSASKSEMRIAIADFQTYQSTSDSYQRCLIYELTKLKTAAESTNPPQSFDPLIERGVNDLIDDNQRQKEHIIR